MGVACQVHNAETLFLGAQLVRQFIPCQGIRFKRIIHTTKGAIDGFGLWDDFAQFLWIKPFGKRGRFPKCRLRRRAEDEADAIVHRQFAENRKSRREQMRRHRLHFVKKDDRVRDVVEFPSA